MGAGYLAKASRWGQARLKARPSKYQRTDIQNVFSDQYCKQSITKRKYPYIWKLKNINLINVELNVKYQ